MVLDFFCCDLHRFAASRFVIPLPVLLSAACLPPVDQWDSERALFFLPFVWYCKGSENIWHYQIILQFYLLNFVKIFQSHVITRSDAFHTLSQCLLCLVLMPCAISRSRLACASSVISVARGAYLRIISMPVCWILSIFIVLCVFVCCAVLCLPGQCLVSLGHYKLQITVFFLRPVSN